MSDNTRKYKFDWEFVGDASDGVRPSLGSGTSLEVYRLFQFAIRDVIEQHYGTEVTDTVFREAGILAGKLFYQKYCAGAKDADELVRTIQEKFKELAIGIVRFEKIDLDNLILQLTVDEDLDCSGLPDTSDHICVYDEGMIKGILDSFTAQDFHVEEIDCWCSGERTCRFKAQLKKDLPIAQNA